MALWKHLHGVASIMGYTLSHLDNNSLRYIATQFEAGQGLAHLLGRVDLGAGVVQAFVPDDKPSFAGNYASGSLRDAEEESTAVTLVCDYLIDSFGLTGDPNIALLGQFPDGARQITADIPSSRQYSTIWLTGATPSYYNGELWFIAGDVDREAARSLLADLLWFPSIATVTNIFDASKLHEGGEINFEALAELVREPYAILVGGWDAMNYLIWTPGSRD
jgi:hypothetical protein